MKKHAYLFALQQQPKNPIVHCAVVELSIKIEHKKSVYKIKTAYPAIMDRLSKNELVCVKPRS